MALEFWKAKTGPMPNYAWGGLILGAALALSSWRKNKEAGAKAPEATSTSIGMQLPESVQPTYAFVDADTTTITWPGFPAGGGRPPRPTHPTPTTPTVPRPTTPTPTTPTPTTPTQPPPAPVGKYVTITKWNATKAPWDSTLWGIATKLLGNGAQWKAIWNAPQNAALRTKRGSETKIQPGDKVWVPGAK